jgi:hypothetical protein
MLISGTLAGSHEKIEMRVSREVERKMTSKLREQLVGSLSTFVRSRLGEIP